MYYVSTRGRVSPRIFKNTLLEGLAPDGGLYMPEWYPELDLNALRGREYVNVASAVFSDYAPDISYFDLKKIIMKTYTVEVFGTKEITPIKMLEPGLGLLQLSNGPTLAFKDVPLQLLGNLMEYMLEKEDNELNILAATSGDTGPAAEHALCGKRRLRVFMLSPYGRMSRFQQRQMYTIDDPRIFNLVVDGTFDDCQALVKKVNADAEFKKRYRLGAVNSINWARIAAQVVYYVYGYLQATRHNKQRVMFAVPSGNFGNALSAYIAQQMGLPIDIIVATNENDVLDEFFHTGVYRVRKGTEVKATSSPSMDIASASNFERFIFDHAKEGASEFVRNLWEELRKTGEFKVPFLLAGSLSEMKSGMATEADVLQTIRLIYNKYGVIIDPHTAVGMHVGLRYRELGEPLIVVETAQPAKFEDTIRQAIGIEPPVPERYKELANLPEYTFRIDPDAEQVKQFIASHLK